MTENKNEDIMSTPEMGTFSTENTRELKRLLTNFIRAYGEKPVEQSDEEWLKERFLLELPEYDEAAALKQSRETISSIHEYDQNLFSLMESKSHGKTAQEWFAGQAASSGISETELADRLKVYQTSLEQATGIQADSKKSVHDVGTLAKKVGVHAKLAGLQSALAILQSVNVEEEEGEPVEAVTQALATGEVSGLKTAAAGSLKVAAERNILAGASPALSTRDVSSIACAAVENIKTIAKAAEKKITNGEATEEFVNTSVTTAATLAIGTAAGKLTSVVLGPCVGPFAGKVVSRVIMQLSGPAINKKVRENSPAITVSVNKSMKRLMSGMKAGIETGKNRVKSLAGKLFH